MSTFQERDPPPSTIRSRAITRASTQIGRPAGSPNTVTPPISMPVMARVSSAGANDALRVPRRSLTARFTSRRLGARTTHAAYGGGSARPATRIVFAESCGAKP